MFGMLFPNIMERKDTLARWLETNPEYIDMFSDFKGTPEEYFYKWNKEFKHHWKENWKQVPYPFIKKSVGSDREEKWNEFKKSTESYYQDTIKYYTDNPLDYHLNSKGFRDIEWFNKPDEVDVYLGDSNTLGTGVLQKDAWPYIVSEHTNFPSLFCGLGASEITAQFKLFSHIVKRFKVRNLFHNPVKKFVTLSWEINKDQTAGIAEWDRHAQPDRFQKFVEIFYPPNTSFLYHMAYNAFKGMCNELGINYHYCDWEISHGEIDHQFSENTNFKKEYRLDSSKLKVLSRDNFHASVYRHRVMANIFLQKLGKKLFV